MAGNVNLGTARAAKNDEFYTQWSDIENEMQAYLEYDPDVFRGKTVLLPCDDPGWSNFSKFFALHFMDYGIKKLISTSYAPKSNADGDDPQFSESIDEAHGKIFVLEPEGITGDGKVDIDDLKWSYLEGDGDFRSDEVTKLRDEADIVITNPPFSLFREFIAWLVDGNVLFSVVGSMNAITYKEIFPLIKGNDMWLGASRMGAKYFALPSNAPVKANQHEENGVRFQKFGNIAWFTNIEHGRRHEPLGLMTMEQNLLYGSKRVREVAYPKYDNYDAIEVPETKGIPSDYDDIMGVPISFLDKHSPERFEILGITDRQNTSGLRTRKYSSADSPRFNDLNARSVIKHENGEYQQVYARILIRHRSRGNKES